MALNRNWRECRREEEVEGEERTRGRSSEIEAKTEFAMTISMAEEADTPSASDNRVCSDGGS